jgi:hypothetical protein
MKIDTRTRRSRRPSALLAVAAFVLAACSGGDDTADTTADTGADSTPDATTDTRPATTTDDDTVADTDDTDTDDTDTDGTGSAPAGGSVGSLADVPEQCRELMADFLRDVEPIVAPIDWQNASLADFERIADEFQQRADDFDGDAVERECDALEFAADDDGLGLIIELAEEVAPGAVAFFGFLDTMRSGMTPSGDDAAAPARDCGDAVALFEGWLNEYDAFSEVPISELAKLGDMAAAMSSCTPAQLSVLDSPELNDFLGR